jgi:hypothetical protein
MAGSEPDRSLVLGDLHIDLWRGLFRDEVRVWIDVRPAAGGLRSSQRVWRGKGNALFDETVRRYTV